MSTSFKSLEGLILFGYCPYAHGIKGAFTFVPINPEDSFLNKGMTVFIKSKNAPEIIEFEISALSKGNKWIMSLKGIGDRNSVDRMTPCELFVERSQFPELSKEKFYFADLMNLDVFNFDTGVLLGKTTSFYHNGAQYVIVMDLESQILELPYTKYFFPEINIEQKNIKIRIPEVVSE